MSASSRFAPHGVRSRLPTRAGFHGWTKYDVDNASFKMLTKIAAVCNNSELVLAANSLDPTAGLLDLAAEWQNRDFNLLDMQCTGDASESGLVKCVQVRACTWPLSRRVEVGGGREASARWLRAAESSNTPRSTRVH